MKQSLRSFYLSYIILFLKYGWDIHLAFSAGTKKWQLLRQFHPLPYHGRLFSFSGILATGDYPFLLDGFFGKKRFTVAPRQITYQISVDNQRSPNEPA
ncbi:MAG: hypothetical protein ACLRSX_07215 [Akkermansia sp.]|jgi:hypothetical protein|uniref:hypothetical protein n=1 Tax=Akkermansia TaxID=239934 RepID=UPI0011AF3D2E|nr:MULTISPECIES: hypothetical protein [Akkermansia]MBO1689065.1 hypothetical protein [Akkermansia sp. GGCC_0220]QWP74480.1 hypothetical protein J5W79_06385 [Akkermansia massiliensis]